MGKRVSESATPMNPGFAGILLQATSHCGLIGFEYSQKRGVTQGLGHR